MATLEVEHAHDLYAMEFQLVIFFGVLTYGISYLVWNFAGSPQHDDCCKPTVHLALAATYSLSQHTKKLDREGTTIN